MVSYFFTKTEVIGLNDVTKKIPKITAIILGMVIIEKFDIPETFMAVTSSVFFIFKKNQIPDNKIIKGNILYNKLGTINKVSNTGTLTETS